MEDKLKKMLSVLLGIEEEEINMETSQETIEGWDSLKQMNIIVAIEEEFDIQLEEEESILADNYKALLEIIQKNAS